MGIINTLSVLCYLRLGLAWSFMHADEDDGGVPYAMDLLDDARNIRRLASLCIDIVY